MKKQSIFSKMKKNYVGYVFISPWVIGFFVFTLYPLLHSIFLSFQKVKFSPTGIKTESVGMENYSKIFTSDVDFTHHMIEFVKQLVISVPIVIVFSLIIALLLNQKIRFKGFFRTIFFLPVIISSGPVMKELTDQGFTAIPNIENYAFYQVLLDNSDNFFVGIITYLITNVISILWFSGVQILIFIAALQKLDKQVYEASMIDGASTWEQFWLITLPSLKPMILVNTIYTIVTISVFSSNPVIEHISKQMFKINTGFGYSSALSWLYFIVIAVIILLAAGILSYKGKRKYG